MGVGPGSPCTARTPSGVRIGIHWGDPSTDGLAAFLKGPTERVSQRWMEVCAMRLPHRTIKWLIVAVAVVSTLVLQGDVREGDRQGRASQVRSAVADSSEAGQAPIPAAKGSAFEQVGTARRAVAGATRPYGGRGRRGDRGHARPRAADLHWPHGPDGQVARRVADWAGRGGTPIAESRFISPLIREVTHLVKSLETAQASAEHEARLRDAGESVWTAERLRAHIRHRFRTLRCSSSRIANRTCTSGAAARSRSSCRPAAS
jgi:hypothetical protein